MSIFDTSILVLGNVSSSLEISANPEKVVNVRDWLTLTNVKEVHSFLGFASYYHIF